MSVTAKNPLLAALGRSESERALLSCCLLDPSILQWLELSDEHFADARCRVVWQAMRSLAGDDIAADEPLLEHALKRAGKLDAIGGLAYLGELATIAATADNVEHYASILRTALSSRRALDLSASIETWVTSGIEGEELLGRISAAAAQLEGSQTTRSRTLPEMIRTEVAAIGCDLEALENGKKAMHGVPIGVASLDELTGGTPYRYPTFVCARPGDGKSAFALALTKWAQQMGFAPHLFSNEDCEPEIAQRWIAHESGIPATDIRRRNLTKRDEFNRFTMAANALLKRDGMRFDEAHGQSAAWIVRRVMSEARSNKTKIVIVDMISKVRPPERGLEMKEAIRENTKILANMAAKLDVALVICAQMNRRIDSRGLLATPQYDDLADSGSIEQDGKFILCLRPAADERRNGADVHVMKNNFGGKGLVLANWDKARGRFWGDVKSK